VVSERDADLRRVGDVLSEARRYFVIFNPASGRGRRGRRLAEYQRLLTGSLDDVTFATSTGPGAEGDLAARAADEGYDVVVAVGGDGTWSNVAHRLLTSGRDDLLLGVLPSGTGNDFGRNVGYDPHGVAEAVRVLCAGHARHVDVGYLSTPSASQHAPEDFHARHFLNVIGFGFDVAVIDAAEGARVLSGALLYKLTALQQLFRFPGFACRVTPPDGDADLDRRLMLTVSNARFFGGGFPIAPGADVSDGRLHACAIRDAAPWTRFVLFNMAERGRHGRSARVRITDSESFRLEFEVPPRFEMDGDIRRASEPVLDVRVLPSALKVIVPAPGPHSTAQST